MKTKIIFKDKWQLLKEYDFLITMSKDDVVEYNDIEYRVDCCLLIIEKNEMLILLES